MRPKPVPAGSRLPPSTLPRIRIAVVTGGSSGIGAALARKLAARGWRCVLLARGRERLARVAREIRGEYEACDVGKLADVERAAAAIGGRHDAVHLLVNNAGMPGRGGFLELTAERIEEVTRVNYLGSVWCLRSFLPLLGRGAPADVVNVCSIAGAVAHGPSGPYAASKHAQLAFSRNVTAELAPRGIRVHSINPAFTETEGFPQDRFSGNGWARRLVMRPERVADAVLDALDNQKIEVFVPGAYRAAAALAGIAPGAMTRIVTRKATVR